MDYEVWVCDNCRRRLPKEAPQHEVRVQQQTERLYGTDTVYRPIERLVICTQCQADIARLRA